MKYKFSLFGTPMETFAMNNSAQQRSDRRWPRAKELRYSENYPQSNCSVATAVVLAAAVDRLHRVSQSFDRNVNVELLMVEPAQRRKISFFHFRFARDTTAAMHERTCKRIQFTAM